MCMPELERLQINIDADASGAKKGAAEAKQAMQSLGTTTKQALNTVSKSTTAAVGTVGRLRSAIGMAEKTTQSMGKSASAQMSNLERIYEAQIARAAALEARIKLLNAELAKAQRKAGTTGSPKAVVDAQDKLARAQTQYAGLVDKIDRTAQKMWELEDAAEQAGDEMEEMGNKTMRGSGKSKTIFSSIGRSLRSMLIITAVSRGVVNFIGWLGRVVAADAQVSASLAAVRQNLLTAFAPIYNAALPAIQTLVGWLVSATQAISNFINALFGMTGRQATNIANKIGGIGGAAGGSAKQVNELIASFDELNKLGSGGGSGGGGGGGGGGGSGGGGGIGSTAVTDSIETLNSDGIAATNVLAGLTQKVTTYGAALFGLSKINRFAIAQGWGGLGKGQFFKTLGKVGLAIDTALSGYDIAKSDWFANGIGSWRDTVASAENSVLDKILSTFALGSQFAVGTITGVGTSLFGMPGSQAMPIFESNIAKIAAEMSSALQKSHERVMQGSVNTWGEMSLMDMMIYGLSGKWKTQDAGAEVSREIGNVGQSASTAIISIGSKVGNAMNEAMALIRNGGGGSGATGGGRGGITQYISEYLTVDEGEINGKLNHLQDIARAVRQSIDNAEAIINKSLENKEMAKPIEEEMPLGMNSATIDEWAAGTAGDKADKNSVADLASAVASVLNGTSVNVDGKKLGELTVKAINKNAKTNGRVDYAY